MQPSPNTASATAAAAKLAAAAAKLAAAPDRRAPTTHVHHATHLKVLLAIPGRISPLVRAIYDILGLKTAVLICSEHGESAYTILQRHLVAAYNAIGASHAPGGSAANLAARATLEPLAALSIPMYQPRVSPEVAEVHEALGLDTVTIEYGGVQYTVLADSADQALAALTGSADQPRAGLTDGVYQDLAARAACAGAEAADTHAAVMAAAACIAAPRRAWAAPGLRLRSHYVGPPSMAIRLLANLYDVRFIRLVDDGGAIYWVPASATNAEVLIGPTAEEVALRLGICA